MKTSIIALLVSFVACAYAAAISLEHDVRDLEKRAAEGGVVSTALEDGSNKVEIFDDGVLEGYIIESENGGGPSRPCP